MRLMDYRNETTLSILYSSTIFLKRQHASIFWLIFSVLTTLGQNNIDAILFE